MKPYRKNPRQITAKRLQRLTDTLARLGDLGGIVHNLETDEIVGGNQRMRVFTEGQPQIIETLPEPDEQGTVAHGFVVWQGKKYAYRQVRWNAETAEEANITANVGAGEWNWDLLANEWSAVDLMDWGLDEDLFAQWKTDAGALGNLLESEKPETVDADVDMDRAEELRQKWGVESGMMFALGDHRLICGDCTDPATVARVMGGEKAILMSTDPPYGIWLDQSWRDKVGINRLGRSQSEHLAGDEEGFDWTSAFLFSNAQIAYVWHGCLYGDAVQAQLKQAGYEVRQQIIWVKDQAPLGRGAYHWKHETCWYAVKVGANANWKGDRSQVTVWEAASPKHIMGGSKDGKYAHPTQKPVLLSEIPIRNHTELDSIVYDPFGGSGTTMVACNNLGRKCRMIELSEKYCSVVLQRMQDAFSITGVLVE